MKRRTLLTLAALQIPSIAMGDWWPTAEPGKKCVPPVLPWPEDPPPDYESQSRDPFAGTRIPIIYWAQFGCAPCKSGLDELGAKRNYVKPFASGRFMIYPRYDAPNWVKEFPTLYFRSRRESGWSQLTGWPGKERFEEIYDGEQQSQQQAVASRPPLVRTRSSRAHWTNPGRIDDHLINDHGVSPSRIRGMSWDQMKTLHDRIHEANVSARSKSKRKTKQKARQRTTRRSYSYCPSGRCP